MRVEPPREEPRLVSTCAAAVDHGEVPFFLIYFTRGRVMSVSEKWVCVTIAKSGV